MFAAPLHALVRLHFRNQSARTPEVLTRMFAFPSRVSISAIGVSLFIASLAIGAGRLAAQHGRPAPVHPPATGATVQPETPGVSGLPGYQVVAAPQSFSIMPLNSPDYGEKTLMAFCPAGKVVLSGGYYHNPREWKDVGKLMEIGGSRPLETGRGWAVHIFNSSPTVTVSGLIQVYAICANK